MSYMDDVFTIKVICQFCNIRKAVRIMECFSCPYEHPICEVCLSEYKKKRGLIAPYKKDINEYDVDFLETMK